jgi:hypothetical protein
MKMTRREMMQKTAMTLDGENYQIGFLDICDTPYWETIAAVRDVS